MLLFCTNQQLSVAWMRGYWFLLKRFEYLYTYSKYIAAICQDIFF